MTLQSLLCSYYVLRLSDSNYRESVFKLLDILLACNLPFMHGRKLTHGHTFKPRTVRKYLYPDGQERGVQRDVEVDAYSHEASMQDLRASQERHRKKFKPMRGKHQRDLWFGLNLSCWNPPKHCPNNRTFTILANLSLCSTTLMYKLRQHVLFYQL